MPLVRATMAHGWPCSGLYENGRSCSHTSGSATQSVYAWIDAQGRSHDIMQGEGGEQGDPLMPGLYSLGGHQALRTVQARPQEAVFAYLEVLPPGQIFCIIRSPGKKGTNTILLLKYVRRCVPCILIIIL